MSLLHYLLVIVGNNWHVCNELNAKKRVIFLEKKVYVLCALLAIRLNRARIFSISGDVNRIGSEMKSLEGK